MMELISGKNNGKVYQISFWSSLIAFFILPIILLFPFIILIITKVPNYDLKEVIVAISSLNDAKFISLYVIIEFISRVICVTVLVGILRKIFIIDGKKFLDNIYKNVLYIVCGIILILLLTIILSKIYYFLGIEGESKNQVMVETIINSNMRPFMFVMVVILAPIFEELLFRKFLIGYLTEKLKLKNWIAIIIASFAFAFMHVMTDIDSMIFIFQYLALSIVLTLSYFLSNNNIYVPIGIHFLNNIISFILV